MDWLLGKLDMSIDRSLHSLQQYLSVIKMRINWWQDISTNNSSNNTDHPPGASQDNTNFGESTKKDNRATSLKVAEAEQRDVGRKIARVDPKVAERLNITSGDALELSSLGKKTTVLSWPARSTDTGSGLIRIDGYTRNRVDGNTSDKDLPLGIKWRGTKFLVSVDTLTYRSKWIYG